MGYLGVEAELQLVLQALVNILQDAQVVLGAQVLAAGLKQVQVVAQGLPSQGLGLRGLGGEALGGGAVEHVDGVYVLDELHHCAWVHKVGEPAAELGGKVELPVGEGARPAEAAHGVAHGTVDALLHLARHNGAAAVVDVLSLVQGQHLQARAAVGQLVGGKDARLAAAQNDDVVHGIHRKALLT